MRLSVLLALIGVSLVIVTNAAAQAGTTVPTPPPDRTHAATQWQLSVSAPAADGSRSVLAALPADAPIASGFTQVTPKLVLRYESGQTVAYVAFDKFLGDVAVNAIVTFGSEPPAKQTWQLSTDGRTAFVPGDALAFIRRLQKVTSFSIRIDRPSGEKVVVSFSPKQTDLVIKALLSAGVKYGG